MSIGALALRGGGWQAATIAVQTLIQFVVVVVLARYVEPAEFGLVAVASMVTNFAMFFARGGLGPALVQRPSITSGHISSAFMASIALGLFCSGTIWLLGPFVAQYFRMPEGAGVIRLVGASLAVTSFGLTAHSLLYREFRFDVLMRVEVTALVLGNLIVAIPMAIAGYGAWAIAWGTMVQAAARSLLLVVLRPHPMLQVGSRDELRELVRFGSGLTVAQLLNFAAAQGDFFVIGRMLGPTPLGLYERSFRLMQVPSNVVGEIVDRASFPLLSRLQDDNERLQRIFIHLNALVVLALVPLMGFTIVMAPEIIAVLFGADWDAVVLPFRILVGGLAFRSLARLVDSLVRAKGAVYRNAGQKAIYAAAVIGGAIIGQRWGIEGVAAGTVLAIILHFVLMGRLALALIGGSWWQLISAHIPGWRCAAGLALLTWVVASLVRSVADSSVVVLLAAVGTAAVAGISAIAFFPRVLGDAPVWLARAMPGLSRSSFLPRRFHILAYGEESAR